ncbi:MAG: flippase [Ignavibacteriaceae bacterium]
MADKKTLIKNFSSLSLLQVSNYIFPIITLPYLLRVLGPDKYGLMSFAAAFTAYFGVFVDYGFNLSIPREISINRENKKKLVEIFSSVIIIKFVIFLISLIIFVVVVLAIPRFYSDKEIFFLSFIYILGQTFLPAWFFQGVEKMQFITIITIPVRALVVILTFIFIHSPGDIYLLIFINSISFVVIGVLSLSFILKNFSIVPAFQSIPTLKYYLKEGFHLFISTLSISLYTVTNIFLLGLLAGDKFVGFFSAADKIRMAVQNLFYTITQTVYPHAARMFNSSIPEGMKFVKKILGTAGTVNFILCMVIFVFAEPIILLVAGNNYAEAIPVLRIISFLPFIVFLSNIYGIVVMLNTGDKQAFTGIVITAAIISIALSFALVPSFRETGTSISAVVAEIFVTVSAMIYVRNKYKTGVIYR